MRGRLDDGPFFSSPTDAIDHASSCQTAIRTGNTRVFAVALGSSCQQVALSDRSAPTSAAVPKRVRARGQNVAASRRQAELCILHYRQRLRASSILDIAAGFLLLV